MYFSKGCANDITDTFALYAVGELLPIRNQESITTKYFTNSFQSNVLGKERLVQGTFRQTTKVILIRTKRYAGLMYVTYEISIVAYILYQRLVCREEANI